MINNISVSMHLWLLVSLLYWTSAPIIGQAMVLGLTLFFIFTSRRSRKNIGIARPLVYLTVASCFLGLIFAPSDLSMVALLTTVHFVILIAFVVLLDLSVSACRKDVFDFANAFILINFLLLFLHFAFDVFPWLYFEDTRGGVRYQFLFAEPSYMGLFTSTLIYIIGASDVSIRIKSVYFLVLSLLILLTQSGSGLVMGFLAVASTNVGVKKSGFNKSYLFAVFPILLVVLVIVLQNDFVNMRIQLLLNDSDTAFYIRFVAPWLTAQNIITESPFVGSGFGYLGEVVLRDYDKYWFLAKFTEGGDLVENTNIDNILAYILSSYGLPFSFLLLYLIIGRVLANGGFSHLIFVATLCFFTGSYVAPLFLGLIFLKIRLNQSGAVV